MPALSRVIKVFLEIIQNEYYTLRLATNLVVTEIHNTIWKVGYNENSFLNIRNNPFKAFFQGQRVDITLILNIIMIINQENV